MTDKHEVSVRTPKASNGASDMVERVEKSYKAWYKVWYDTFVPKLLFRPKWFKDECDLKVGDLVYFQKSESELSSNWTLGMIAELERSRDGLIRKAKIKYRNATESEDITTRRSVRTFCKIWSVEDFNLQDDLMELSSRLEQVPGYQVLPNSVLGQQDVHGLLPVQVPAVDDGGQVASVTRPIHTDSLDSCCCLSHCAMIHNSGTKLRSYQALVSVTAIPCDLSPEIPFFRSMLLEPTLGMVDDGDLPLDNLSDFLLNHNRV